MKNDLISNHHKGFTLAEVLITLAVLGVIAAITIAALVPQFAEPQYRKQWKKSYAEISAITKRLASENGGSVKGLFTDQDTFKNQYRDNLNYSKDCNINDSSKKCWHNPNQWYYLNGSPLPSGNNPPSLVLSNGSLVKFWLSSSTCTAQLGTLGGIRCGHIDVDVNGFKGPNMQGKDVFGMYIVENNALPHGVPGGMDGYSSCIQKPDTGWDAADNQGMGCSAKYLRE